MLAIIMCGRFTLRCPIRLLADAFGLSQEPPSEPCYNLAPTQQVPIIGVQSAGPANAMMSGDRHRPRPVPCQTGQETQ